MGIYKRKQESKKTRKKRELDQESDQEKKKTRKKTRTSFSFFLGRFLVFLIAFLVEFLFSCFLTFLFSFINSHLWEIVILQYFWSQQYARLRIKYQLKERTNLDLLVSVYIETPAEHWLQFLRTIFWHTYILYYAKFLALPIKEGGEEVVKE